MIGGTKFFKGASVPYASKAMKQTGWVDLDYLRAGQQHDWKKPPRDLRNCICYSCYNKGHFARDCTLPLRGFGKVVLNYEALRPQERERVPKDFHEMNRNLVSPKKAQPLSKDDTVEIRVGLSQATRSITDNSRILKNY